VSELSVEDAYERYADELVRYATVLVPRSVAADVVADTFADLLRTSGRALSNARDERAFLFGAVANRARMHHRQNTRRHRREAHVAIAGGSGIVTLPEDRHDEMRAAFDALSVQQRAVTYLTYWQDYTVGEVADALGVGEGTVRRQLARARDRLRGALS
jgi:RNA polymerase sigma factor (sigma-70 family)